ncbi:flagellar hook-length control protein FliK [Sporosarcina sp. UB5]|uniref:flagellar hook-length control protein FliK n=1 Tax=Sporosarcina sp. UB5 TaxID=3047463 RepID=UPI003D7A4F9C
MNIGALQSMMGMNQVSTNNIQKQDPATTKFGAVFANVTNSTSEIESPIGGDVPIEWITDVFNASTIDEFNNARRTDNALSLHIEQSGNGSLEDIAKLLTIDTDETIENLQQLLKKSGMTKVEIDELTIASDIWTLLNMIDEVGIRFFDNLNEALQNPASRDKAFQLQSLVKLIDLIAQRMDMVITMEQKADSLRQLLTHAAGQFEQRIVAMEKQDQPFIQQKTDFRIVLETNSATSTNAEGSGQKQGDTPLHSSSAHAAATTARVEISVHQTDSPSANRSESFLREMQALMKRSNFGQVGGSNRMLIKLYPEHLGQIRIELLETNGIMTARILASTAFAKGLLDSQLHQLKHAFNQQNLQVDRVDISQTIQESQRNEREQSFNEQFKREQQTDDNKHTESPDEERSFEEYMIELEV